MMEENKISRAFNDTLLASWVTMIRGPLNMFWLQ